MSTFDVDVIVVESDGDTIVIEMPAQPVSVVDVTDRPRVEILRGRQPRRPPRPRPGPPARPAPPARPSGPQGPQGNTGATARQGCARPARFDPGRSSDRRRCPLVELTQADYDALAVKDPQTMYVIIDGADRTVLAGTSRPAAGTGINGSTATSSSTTPWWTVQGPESGQHLARPTGVDDRPARPQGPTWEPRAHRVRSV